MKYLKLNIFLIITSLLLFSKLAWSDTLSIKLIPENEIITQKVINFIDSATYQKETQDILNKLLLNGFAAASLVKDTVNHILKVYTGEQYKIANFKLPDEFNKKKYQLNKSAFSPGKLTSVYELILKEYENNGFPFASINIKELNISENKISGEIIINKGALILYDSLIIKGPANISEHYLQQYLQIGKNGLYSEKNIKSISKKIKEIPFLQEIKPAEIVFYQNKADVYLYLNKKQANSFNGILGVLPVDQNKPTERKVLITGDMDISLKNALHKGEAIQFKWRKTDAESQILNALIEYPYIFKSDFGLSTGLEINKKDSSFIKTNFDIGIKYFFNGTNYISGLYQAEKSNTLLNDSIILSSMNIKNMQASLYGISFLLKKLDYIYNPRKGYRFSGTIMIGNKKIENKDKGLKTKNTLNLDVFIPLFKNATILSSNKFGFMYSKEMLTNELFEIGGINNFRGFDENIFQESAYYLSSLEYRFIYEENSAAFAFIETGFMQNRSSSIIKNNTLAFGIGTNFQTKAGIFSFTYALGKSKQENIRVKNAKIHIGYLNRF